jgi:hypothetical protein
VAARAVPAHQAGCDGFAGGAGELKVSEFPTCSRPHWIAPASLPFLEAAWAIYGLGVMTDGGPKQLRALAKSYERAPSLRLIALLSPSHQRAGLDTGLNRVAVPWFICPAASTLRVLPRRR